MNIEDKKDFKSVQKNIQKQDFEKIKLITKKFLLPLRYHMKDVITSNYKEKKIRVYAATAITKVIRRLPLKVFAIEFHRIIRNISEVLKSRDFEIRNNARKVLIEISSLTGPYFLFMIIKELSYMLKRGYQKHILNYTIYLLLKNMIIKDD